MPPLPPLPLPRFTFLCGPPLERSQREFAFALSERDDSLDIRDFEEPLRVSTEELLFGGSFSDCDLTDPVQRHAAVFPPELTTVEDWLNELTTVLRNTFSPNVIGRLALANYLRRDSIYNRTIYRDCGFPSDARVFVDHFGTNECLFIHLGGMEPGLGYGPRTFHIWLPEDGLDKRLARLEAELATISGLRGVA